MERANIIFMKMISDDYKMSNVRVLWYWYTVRSYFKKYF